MTDSALLDKLNALANAYVETVLDPTTAERVPQEELGVFWAMVDQRFDDARMQLLGMTPEQYERYVVAATLPTEADDLHLRDAAIAGILTAFGGEILSLH